jgi:adenylate cyclase
MSIDNEPKDDLLLNIWQAIELVGEVRERSDELEPSELEAALADAEELLAAAVSRVARRQDGPTRHRRGQAAYDTPSRYASSSGTASVIPFPGAVTSKAEENTALRTGATPGINQPAQLNREGADAEPAPARISEIGARLQRGLSIVVLPFSDLSCDPEQQYLADGITEDVTANLSRFTDMLVISRSTAFTFRNKPFEARQIGRELGVRYVLEGSVRRSGRRVRVNAQLIDAEVDALLWADRFEGLLSDLFELQDEFTNAIAGAIEPELLKCERNRIARRPPQTEDTYELYQRGLWHFYRYTKNDSLAAESLFRRALAIDTQYPQPIAQLAITLCNAAYLGWADDATRNYVEAYDLAQRAVGLDARYPPANFALGLVCMWTRRSDFAMSSFQEAINLNPSYAPAHILLGQMHLYGGHPEEAIALVEKGIRLSPKDPRLFMWLPALAGAHYQLRHYAEAIEAGCRSWLLNRNWPAGLRYVVAGLARSGRVEEAKAALEELKSLNPDLAFVEGNLSRLYNDRAAIDHILDGLRAAGFD